MKKKLLAVVLSVVMIAALLVPMMAISAADAPTATISLGTPFATERDYDEDGVSEANVLGVPVYFSENTGAAFAFRYQILSNDGLIPYYNVFNEGMGDEEYADEGWDKGDFERKVGKDVISLNYTGGRDPVDTDKTGFQVVQDSTSGTVGINTAEGQLGTAYFVLPTTPGTYTFEVKWMDGCDPAQARYVVTNGAPVSYTVECTEHVAGDPVITDPTCTVAGSKVVNCTACGAEMSNEPIAATGHKAGEPEVTKEATCTEKGAQVIKCTVCTETIKTEEIAALGHDWDNGVVADGVKCGETADTTFTCKVCRKTRVETGAVVEHDMVADEANSKAPTCTEDGVAATKCAREGCDHKDSKPVPALGHNMVADEANSKAPTCTEEGIKATKCANEGCDHKDSEPVDALGHTEGEYEETKAPTCTEAGEEVAKCTVCGEVVDTNEIDPLGHDDDIEVVTVPTADAEGAYKLVCLVCGEVVDEGTLAKLTNVVEHKDADGKIIMSFKSDEPILPEDIMFFPVDMDEEGESIVIAFVSSIIEELEGKVEFAVTLGVEEKGTFKVTTMDADGKEVAVDVAYKDGVLSFEADLASEYTLTFEEDKPVVNPEGDKSETEPNGDTVNTVVFAVVALAAVAGLVVVGKKRFAL